MKTTPIRAIRAKCFGCAGSRRAATRCEKEDCPLYPYRTGRNPARAGIGRALTTESARITRNGTSQVVDSADKKWTPQGSTPEFNLGHPRAKNGEVAGPHLTPAETIAMALLFGQAGGGK